MILLRRLEIRAFKHLHSIDLHFPRQGSVLIEGANESGKSSLFEAIYFALYGASLVGEDGPPTLAALLPHDGSSATVSLSLAVATTELEIRRTLTLGKRQAQHDARLLVRRPQAMPEELYGARAVSDRVILEMHGLDGDALRNSCFMEQRALDRVEALSKASREDAIAKLLGLERLVGIERDLKPAKEELAELTRARTELMIAEKQRDALAAAQRAEEAATRLGAGRLVALVGQRDTLSRQRRDHEDQGELMRERAADLEERISQAQQASALLGTLDGLAPTVATVQEAVTRIEQRQARIGELNRIEREDLPVVETRLTQLRAVEADLAAAEQARANGRVAAQKLRVAELDARLEQLDHLIPALDIWQAANAAYQEAQTALRLAQSEAAASATVDQLQIALTRAEADTEAAQAAVHQTNVRDIIAYWVRLKDVETLKRDDHKVALIAEERDKISARVERLHRRQTRLPFAVVVSLLALLVSAGLSAVMPSIRIPLLLAAVVAFLCLWVFGALFFNTYFAGRRATSALRDAERTLNMASIRSEAANLLGGSVEDLPRVEEDLRAAGAAIPPSLEVGRATLAEMRATDPTSLADAQEHARETLTRTERSRLELDSARAQLAATRRARQVAGQMEGAARDLTIGDSELRIAQADHAASAAEATARALLIEPFTWPVERAAVHATYAELAAQRVQAAAGLALAPDEVVEVGSAQGDRDTLQAAEQRHTDAARQRLTVLQLSGDQATIAAARGATEADVARLRSQIDERAALAEPLQEELARVDAMRASLSSVVSETWQSATVMALVPEGERLSDGHTNLAAVLRDRETLREAIVSAHAALDDQSARADLAGLRAQQGAHVERGVSLADAETEAVRQAGVALAEHNVPAQGHESLETLAAYWPLLATINADSIETHEQALADAERDAHFARRTADELASQHEVDLGTIDEAECRERIRALEELLRRRELAMAMARDVRTRIVRRVLPETETHMRALLPELTAGRYRDVQLLRSESDPTSADLRIRVWDQVAGRYVAKSLFSGGTRDQCSLALRMAFALATLPKELGALPGFIFLDEPLSAFDAERSQALVQVLTQGRIAGNFAQVFLISHSQSFDPTSFSAILRLADGRVVESTLPNEQAAEALWQRDALPIRTVG